MPALLSREGGGQDGGAGAAHAYTVKRFLVIKRGVGGQDNAGKKLEAEAARRGAAFSFDDPVRLPVSAAMPVTGPDAREAIETAAAEGGRQGPRQGPARTARPRGLHDHGHQGPERAERGHPANGGPAKPAAPAAAAASSSPASAPRRRGSLHPSAFPEDDPSQQGCCFVVMFK